SAASLAVYPALRVADLVAKRPPRVSTGRSLCWTTEFHKRFDSFREEMEAANPHVLLSVRDTRTLNWHFKHSLEQDRLWILSALEGTRMIAYAIFQLREIQSLGLSRVMLVDYQTCEPDRLLA